MKAEGFEDLGVWQKAHTLVLDIYKLTNAFPDHELFGLVSQMRRSAVSVPANIPEGFKKTGVADKLRYFNISQGSLEETRYYLILANDLAYGDTKELIGRIDEVGRMLAGYMKSIKRNSNR